VSEHWMKKKICLTIDVEPDFGGLLAKDVYCGMNNLGKLEEIVRKYNLKLTAFVTGKSLEDNPDILKHLKSMNCEIEQHSYSHQVGHDSKLDDIKKGIKIHEKIVGDLPYGYRAPQGIITQKEVFFLESMGIKYDSSIFPSFFPGRYNRLKFPLIPYIIKNSSIMEIPFGVVRRIRIPISLSYIQLLGLSTFELLLKLFGLPELLVYDFHTFELGKTSSYHELPCLAKFGYYRAQRLYSNPVDVFEKFVKYVLSQGYESKYMIDVYNEIRPNLPIWDWIGD
jgi:hypothetical protein